MLDNLITVLRVLRGTLPAPLTSPPCNSEEHFRHLQFLHNSTHRSRYPNCKSCQLQQCHYTKKKCCQYTLHFCNCTCTVDKVIHVPAFEDPVAPKPSTDSNPSHLIKRRSKKWNIISIHTMQPTPARLCICIADLLPLSVTTMNKATPASCASLTSR